MMALPTTITDALEIVLITGMSGSGKSVALHALEDVGFYCVDNLPPELLLPFVELELQHHAKRLAIAMDVRSATSLPQVPQQLDALRACGIVIKPLFLDASTDTLVRRYSESRRRHPLSQTEQHDDFNGQAQVDRDERRALIEAIELERKLLEALRAQAHVIDSSMIRATQLQSYIKSLVSSPGAQLTLVFESFAFKRGVPTDADFVFDVRMLPNPHYAPALKNLTGQDQPVIDFLMEQPDVQRMLRQVSRFLDSWLPDLARDNRSYVTVAIGCTGGQHRSVYLVEQLVKRFSTQWATLKRHREMDARI